MTAAIVALVRFSSSRQDPAAPPPRLNAHGAASAPTALFGRQNWVQPSWFYVSCTDVPAQQHNKRQETGRAPPTIEFRHRSDSQSLGTGCGIRRQILFFNAHVSSINPFSLSTYFCYPKGIHPKATLCPQMLLHHWVCQSLVTNQPLTFTLSSTSWAIQPNTATSSSHNNCWTCKIHS